MRSLLYLFALLPAAGMIAQALPAVAEPPVAAAPMNDAELADQVGGLSTPDGIDFTFGAVVTTYVDGRVALQSQVVWTNAGAVETVLAGDTVAGPAGGISTAAAGSRLYVPGAGGGTLVTQAMVNGAITSFVLNTADNRSIRQDTVMTLNVRGLDQIKAAATAREAQMRMQDSLNQALAMLPR
jgi:hypothetical protein